MPVAHGFRVFVSSTFEDLRVERDLLQEVVFPRLREFCATRGTRLHAIDLRWGVSGEAAVDQQTVPICLKEIARCHAAAPRSIFLVLLGERYGWRPPPPEVPAAEFDRLRTRLGAADRRLVESWYEGDDNADPPCYRLLPRVGERAAFADPEAWRPVEVRLRRVLAEAAGSLGLPPDRLAAYAAAVTEQEIAAGPFRVARRKEDRVFCFLRDLEASPAAPAQQVAEEDADSGERLEALRRELEKRFGDRVMRYRARWTEAGPCPDVVRWTRDVSAALEGAVERLLLDPGDGSRTAPRGPLDEEIETHCSLAARHHGDFSGRGAELAAIARYLGGPDRRPLCVAGAGGAGKSALLAEAWRRACGADSDAVAVLRLLGSTAASSDPRSLLASLCRQLGRGYGAVEAAPPATYREAIAAFDRHLAQAAVGRRLILVLDALDRLAEPAGADVLAWLPRRLPEHVKVVLSSRPGALLHRVVGKGAEVVELGPLTEAAGERLLDDWLREPPARRLRPQQRRSVLDAFAASGLPVQLRLACAEARRWTSGAEPTPALATDVAGLLRRLVARLTRPEHHGEALVAHTLGYLVASRFGLAEDELLELLSRDPEVYAGFLKGSRHPPADALRCARDGIGAAGGDDDPERWLRDRQDDVAAVGAFLAAAWSEGRGPRLPAVLWARLAADLEPYLAERPGTTGSLLGVYDQELREVAEAEFLAGDQAREIHRRLAAYFRSRADPAGDKSWSGEDPRGVGELAYHLIRGAASRSEVVELLTDFRYLEQRASAAGDGVAEGPAGTAVGVHALADDLDLALRELTVAGDGAAAAEDEAPVPIVVTAVDFGSGLEVRCPVCHRSSPLGARVPGGVAPCPQSDCRGRLRLNPFVVTREEPRPRARGLWSRLRRRLG